MSAARWHMDNAYHDEVQRIIEMALRERAEIIESALRQLPLGWFLCVHKNNVYHAVPKLDECDGVEREVMGPMTAEIRKKAL